MGRSHLRLDVLLRLVTASFENPTQFQNILQREVTRNRSVHSTERRELTNLAFDAVRWRRRLWGEIAPTALSDDGWIARIEEAKALKSNPPLSKWASLTPDSLAREVSFPTWILERWLREFGFESAVSLALAMNEPAPATLRTNLLKTTRDKLLRELKRESVVVKAGSLSPWSIHLEGRKNLQGLRSFKAGHFEIQDESSQVAVLRTEAKPGQTVIDACAGAGGKALALAALMDNRGTVVATDSDSRKSAELKSRTKRAGAKIIESVWVAPDDPHPLGSMKEKADVVFIDAPCSGLGTLRRSPWLKWTVSPATVSPLPDRQLALLRRFSPLCKPGGRLLYATCTLLAAENDDISKVFLTGNAEFRALGEPQILRPDIDGTDGFYVAVFERSSKS